MMSKTLTVRNLNGDTIAEYPDFDPGDPIAVLPARDGSNVVAAGDGWEFAGPTRHPGTAVIRDCRHRSTVHVDRDRLRPR